MPCLKHPDGSGSEFAGCKLPSPLETDILVGCAPCQPYAQSRRGVGVADPRGHKSYGAIFAEDGSLLSHVKALCPHVFITENVLGMTAKYKGEESSPKEELIQEMMDIERSDGTKHFASCGCAKLDSKMWIPGSRPRLANTSCHGSECCVGGGAGGGGGGGGGLGDR